MTAGFWQQTGIYFRKIVRVALRERFYKSLIFSAIIALLVMAVCSDGMLKDAYKTRSCFFTLCSACIWVGIFNSIQNVCREHEIIHADARAGMMISAYVNASMLWQIILSFLETLIFFLVTVICVDFGLSASPGCIFGAPMDLFLTIFLMLVGSSCLGLFISSIANNGTIAMTIMPFVLILQLIMCGALFPMEGAATIIAVLTFSKWGLSACGVLTDMNHIGSGFMPADRNVDYDPVAGKLLLAWFITLVLTAVFFFGTILVLKIRNRDGPLIQLTQS